MDNNNKQHSTTRAVSGGGLSIAGVTLLVLTILKLTNCIDMSWGWIIFWTLVPSAAITIVAIIISLIIAFIIWIIMKRND